MLMRIVHTRPLCPSDISPASGGNLKSSMSIAMALGISPASGGNSDRGITNFGMLRLTLGRRTVESNACEVSARSELTGAVDTKNGDQEV